ncbi:MAG: NYN domain-containing protein [Candidatus Omnitrophota bacterium]
MSLQYIIDGYNLINHPLFARLHKTTEHKENALLDFIRIHKLCGKPKNKGLVVFDGYKDLSWQGGSCPDIEVVFSRRETADERIKRIVEAGNRPKNLVVVSDDREIAFFARQAGAQPMSVEDFLCRAHPVRRLQATAEKKSKRQKEEPDPKISYSLMHKINQELSQIWLKED